MNRSIEAGAILILAVMFFSGPIADTILANAIGPEDLELPHVAYPMRATAEWTQTVGGQGEGLDCSLPFGIDFLAFPRKDGLSPISLRMRQACVFHDYCYRHGAATYDYTQADCDYMLQEQAFRLCSQIYVGRSIAYCETEARKVTLGIRLGGWDAYKRADALPSKRGSTYFEFDPYPLRSPFYRTVRVADAPEEWRAAGAHAKAFYIFRVKQSGMELRIVGMDDDGRCRYAELRMSGGYDRIAVPPLVARSRADGRDWLVWWRREALTNTQGSFAGISPGTASLSDWQHVFGAITETGGGNCDESRFPTGTASDVLDDAASSARPTSAFVDFRPYYEVPPSEDDQDAFETTSIEEDEDGIPRPDFWSMDSLTSEFLPLYPGGGNSRRNLPLAFYGLTTHGCSVRGDSSTCLAEIEIDPESEEKHALYEPYVAYDPRCIFSPDHRLYEDAKAARGSEVCDRYRNFAHAPFISTRDGVPELLWVRRGNSAGAGYDRSALLRRAPRRDSTDRGALSGHLANFDTFALDGYSEQLEPSALMGESGEALVSVVEGGFFGRRCLQFHRIRPRQIDEFKDKISLRSTDDAPCIAGLDGTWLERPWQMLPDGTMLFFRTNLQHVDGAGEDEPERWDVGLEVAVVDPAADDLAASIAPAGIVGSIKLCRRWPQRNSSSDAAWVLRTGVCSDYSDTELARGRDDAKQLPAAARIMRGAPIVIADMNADGAPDIGVLLPDEGRNVTFLPGRRDAGRLAWSVQGE